MTLLSDIGALLGDDPVTAQNLGFLQEQLGTRVGVIPFVGAGLSAPFEFPQWGAFLTTLAGEANLTHSIAQRLAATEYEEAAQELLEALGTRSFQDRLAACFGDERVKGKPTAGKAVAELVNLPPGPIITTNFDRVIETAFAEAGCTLTPYWHSYATKGSEALQQDKPFLLKLHGDWDDPTTRTLTLDEYRKAYGLSQNGEIQFDLPIPTLLFKLLATRCCLFLGCSLKQDRTMQLLRDVAKGVPELVHYAIVERPADDTAYHQRAAELSNQSIRPIWYPPGRHDLVQPVLAALVRIAWQGLRRLVATAPAAHSPAAPDNLPALADPTIGRATEIAQITAMVRAARLITIMGAGGCGKSRLAIEVARAIHDQYDKGVWFIQLADLAPSADQERVLSTRIGRLVGVAEQPRPPLESLAEFFSSGRSLLVLDNCEHLIASCQEILEYLIPRCSDLTVIATSRRSLHVMRWERFYQLAPLQTPDAEMVDPGEIARNESVRLFVERARRRDPNWELRPSAAVAVASLCRALDGMPLAIEVAAARLGVKSVETMQEQSDNLLAALGNRSSGDLRTWTLTEALQWSYRLLTPAHQRTMRLMTIFDGGWTEDAARALVGDDTDEDVADQLQELQDNSLIVTSDNGPARRFRFLEPIRQMAERQLTADERADSQRRHAEFFVRLAERAAPRLLKEDQAEWLDRLQADVDNMRAAIRWSVATMNPEYGLRMMAALWRFAEIRGFLREGRERAGSVLALEGAPALKALYSKVLSGAGMLAYRQADLADAEAKFRASLDIETQLGNASGIANSLNDLGNVANLRGDYEGAYELYGRSLEIERKGTDARAVAVALFNLGWLSVGLERFDQAEALLNESLERFGRGGDTRERAFPLNWLGRLCIATGDPARGRRYATDSLAIWQTLKDMKGVADSRRTLAWASVEESNFADARQHLVESLTLANGVGDTRGLAETLEIIGLLYARENRAEMACEILTAAERTRARINYAISPLRARLRDRAIAQLSAALTAEQMAHAARAGEAVKFPDSMEDLLARLKSSSYG